MACPKCETERAAEKLFCRHCFDIFPQPRKVGRLRRWLGLGPREPVERIIAPEPKSDDHDSRLADLARDAIQEATRAGGPAETRVEILEALGVESNVEREGTGASLDEMPADLRSTIREALEKSSD